MRTTILDNCTYVITWSIYCFKYSDHRARRGVIASSVQYLGVCLFTSLWRVSSHMADELQGMNGACCTVCSVPGFHRRPPILAGRGCEWWKRPWLESIAFWSSLESQQFLNKSGGGGSLVNLSLSFICTGDFKTSLTLLAYSVQPAANYSIYCLAWCRAVYTTLVLVIPESHGLACFRGVDLSPRCSIYYEYTCTVQCSAVQPHHIVYPQNVVLVSESDG